MNIKRFFEAIIFDCDGVLADSEPLDNEIVSILLKELGYVISPDAVRIKSSGLTDEAMWALFEGELARPIPIKIKKRWEEMLIGKFRSRLLPMPGVVAVVKRLWSDNIPLSVASNGPLQRMTTILDILELTPYFNKRLFSSSMVREGKPSPDIYLLAASQIGESPSRCVVIEDSLPGVQAGISAGMTVLGYCPKGDLWGLKQLGIKTFNHMNDLIDLLGLVRHPSLGLSRKD